MTVSSTNRKAGPYTGTGAVSAYPFSFRVFTAADVLVVRTTAGIGSPLVLGSDYTIALNADQSGSPGGTINLTTALASGSTLVATSQVTNTQGTHLTNGGNFNASTIEDALDRATVQIQQLQQTVDGTVQLSLTAPAGVSTTLPTPAGLALLGWNAGATALQNFDSSTLASLVAYGTAQADVFTGDGVTTAFTLTANPAALANLDVSIAGVTKLPTTDYTWTTGATITFTTAPANGAKVLVRYMQGLPQGSSDAGSTNYSDGATYGSATAGYRLQQLAAAAAQIFIQFLQAGAGAASRSLQSKLRDSVSPLDFGAKGDGATDDAANLNAALSSGALVVDGSGLTFKILSSVTVPAGVTFRNYVLHHGTAGMNGLLVNNGSKVTGKHIGTGTTNIVERAVYPAADGVTDVEVDVEVTNMTFGVQAQPTVSVNPKRWKGRLYAHDMVGAIGVSEGYGLLLSPAENCQIEVEAYNIPRHAVYLSAGARMNDITLNVDTCTNYACQLYSTAAQAATTQNTIRIKARNLSENVAGNSAAVAIVQNAHRNTIYLDVEGGTNTCSYAATVQGVSGSPYPYKNRIICQSVTGQFIGSDVINLVNADSTIVEGAIDAYATFSVVATRTAGTNGSTHGGYLQQLQIDAQAQSIRGIYSEVTTVPTYIGESTVLNNGTGARVSDSTSGKRQGYTRRTVVTGTTGSIGAGSYLDVTITLPIDIQTTTQRHTSVTINALSVDYSHPVDAVVLNPASSTTALVRFYNGSTSAQTVSYELLVEGD